MLNVLNAVKNVRFFLYILIQYIAIQQSIYLKEKQFGHNYK